MNEWYPQHEEYPHIWGYHSSFAEDSSLQGRDANHMSGSQHV